MNTDKTTTNLDTLMNRWEKDQPPEFTWGKVIGIHTVGEKYVVIEFVSKHSDKIEYHPYVKGRDVMCSFNTFDGALIYAIAYNNLEVNEARWMAIGAAKLLGVEE